MQFGGAPPGGKIGFLGPFLNVSGAETSLDRRRIKFCVFWCTIHSKRIRRNQIFRKMSLGYRPVPHRAYRIRGGGTWSGQGLNTGRFPNDELRYI